VKLSSLGREFVHARVGRGRDRALFRAPFTRLCLMDVDERRLGILAGLAGRMLARAGLPAVVTATTERRRALDGRILSTA